VEGNAASGHCGDEGRGGVEVGDGRGEAALRELKLLARLVVQQVARRQVHHGGATVPASSRLGAHAQFVDDVGSAFETHAQLDQLDVAPWRKRLRPIGTTLQHVAVAQTHHKTGSCRDNLTNWQHSLILYQVFLKTKNSF
jgi:hypothetical protein